MSSLTWGLYLAAVLGNVGVVFAMAAGFTLIFCGIFFSTWATRIDSLKYNRDQASDKKREGARTKRDSAYKYFLIPFTFMVISAVLPSTKTVHLMLASELGEHVATAITPEAKEIYTLIKQTLIGEVKKVTE